MSTFFKVVPMAEYPVDVLVFINKDDLTLTAITEFNGKTLMAVSPSMNNESDLTELFQSFDYGDAKIMFGFHLERH